MTRKSFFVLLLAAPMALFAQRPDVFTIKGRLKNMEAGWIYLQYVRGGANIFDSARVEKGSYAFRGNVDESRPALLMDARPTNAIPSLKDRAIIFLSPDSFSITHTDSFSNAVMSGPKANAEYQELVAIMQPHTAKEMALMPAYGAAQASGDTMAVQTIGQQIMGIEAEKKELYGKFVKDHSSSPVALHALEVYAGEDIDAGKIRPLYDGLSAGVRESGAGKAFGENLAIVEKTAIGREAMDFTQNDSLGRPVKLSSFRGKWVLLDFWASWCGPCRAENPNVVKAYEKFHAKGLEILGVSLDRPEDKTNWIKAIHDDRLSWTQVSDLGFWNNAVARLYGIKSIPGNFLIDPKGKIVGKNLRGEELEKKLEELIGGAGYR